MEIITLVFFVLAFAIGFSGTRGISFEDSIWIGIFIASACWGLKRYLLGDIIERVYDLSDDINEIKKKLGLDVESRTPRQKDVANTGYIESLARKGASEKEIMEFMGLMERMKWREHIKSRVQEYKNSCYCEDCDCVYFNSDYVEMLTECPECKKKLVPVGEKKVKEDA